MTTTLLMAAALCGAHAPMADALSSGIDWSAPSLAGERDVPVDNDVDAEVVVEDESGCPAAVVAARSSGGIRLAPGFAALRVGFAGVGFRETVVYVPRSGGRLRVRADGAVEMSGI